MRFLALDLGDKRTGIASGDDVTGMAMPVGVIETPMSARAGEELIDAIARVVREQLGQPPAGEVVVGLPLNMDGTDSPRSKSAREFALRIAARLGIPVHLQDERKTTDIAIQRLGGSGLTHKQKKERRDAIAAAVMLESFLLARRDDRAHAERTR